LINSSRDLGSLGLEELLEPRSPDRIATVAATELAREHVGRPLPNAALLGAFARLTGAVSMESVAAAIRERFPGAIGEANVAAAEAAFALGGTPRQMNGAEPGGRAPRQAGSRRQERDGAERQIEGSRAIAETVALCRPEVISAYPISPQTHIVERLSALVQSGHLAPCEYVNVESEFAAMSVAIGASATGARAYTATASQGLLYMAEALYNASGLSLPIVMTVANRALGAPINIWNDHSDSMSQRDSGWIQLYAQSNQEAIDMHMQAFRLAEQLSLPVMVCVDGFILPHAVERLELPSPAEVDAFLPPFEPRQLLDPTDPVTIGAMVGPEAFMEVRYLAHHKQMQALDEIPGIAASFEQRFGRPSGGLLHHYRTTDAQLVIVALGSVVGTIEDVVDQLREQGVRVGVLAIKTFRPWPAAEVREALAGAERVLVLEKALSIGIGGIVSQNVHSALEGTSTPIHTAIAGLGGRPITKETLQSLLARALVDELGATTFVDLRRDLVDRELARELAQQRSGPHAENMLRDLGAVTAGPLS
jgi:pyruvate ferredoxin oxidoreductase alpha subunit